MTFTFGYDLTSDIDFVRFETGDTTADTAYLSDELITSLVAQKGGTKPAVIAAIKYIITQLSKPNFRADWLQVDYEKARMGYQKMLADKQGEYGTLLKQAAHTPVKRRDEVGDDD